MIKDIDKCPYYLSKDDQIVDGVNESQSEKLLVIFAANTVVEELAMMIEVICASVAAHTVVTTPAYLFITNWAYSYLEH